MLNDLTKKSISIFFWILRLRKNNDIKILSYRCWEALMMGTIPLLVSTPIDYLFDRLPVIIVDDWNKITPEYLMQKYEIILKNIDHYDFSSLYTDYWINLLSSKKKDLDDDNHPL
jgi:hypothetical protein